MNNSLSDYIENLLKAKSFDEAFAALQHEVFGLGIDGVLYTYIPKPLLQSNFGVQPVYQVSESYCPSYLDHYFDARFDKVDPIIRAVNDGVTETIDWWGDICESYTQTQLPSREVMDVSRSYGIANGFTIPLMSGTQGIAGASFISHEKTGYSTLLANNLPALKRRTELFHKMVVADGCYVAEFIRPLLNSFSRKQLQYVAGLAVGKTTAQLATELRTTPGYLEQTMLKLRRKLSGVGEFDKPTISRNQVLYYAGLLNLLESDLLN